MHPHLTAQAAANPNANSIALATSTYYDQKSFAISYQHRFGQRWTCGISISSNGTARNTAVSIGGSYGW